LFGRERLVELEPPRVGPPAHILESWTRTCGWPDAFAGDGALKHGSLIGTAAEIVAERPLAGTIGLMAVHRAGEAVDPGAVMPLYVRRPDVELARERG
jgi:hypothetical protein